MGGRDAGPCTCTSLVGGVAADPVEPTCTWMDACSRAAGPARGAGVGLPQPHDAGGDRGGTGGRHLPAGAQPLWCASRLCLRGGAVSWAVRASLYPACGVGSACRALAAVVVVPRPAGWAGQVPLTTANAFHATWTVAPLRRSCCRRCPLQTVPMSTVTDPTTPTPPDTTTTTPPLPPCTRWTWLPCVRPCPCRCRGAAGAAVPAGVRGCIPS